MFSRPWFRYLLLILWMALIYRASATPDLRAVPLAQRFGFLPAVLGTEATNLLELTLRKGAHMLSFGILASLARWALAPKLSGWRLWWAALGVTVLYAASDEYHQTFVPTRHGAVTDVMIDTAGAVIALLAVKAKASRHRRSATQ